jgi:hypothetical protein
MPNYYEPYASIDVFNKSAARHILEDRLYTTTLLDKPPALPARVEVLTAKDHSVRSVPVHWNAFDQSLLDAPGQFTVTGSTAYGTVTAVVDVVVQT